MNMRCVSSVRYMGGKQAFMTEDSEEFFLANSPYSPPPVPYLGSEPQRQYLLVHISAYIARVFPPLCHISTSLYGQL